ncbi:hypothetical protein L9F63_017346 [Diploptera punctata]|uniref:Uncharacterized protein n=1 Tax=Diploptera punctata TaxID=6984 RepID=A0AAD7ZZ62_DIPPU|nr:hypothetical protein L9F63_017346 [Diploptera punctata]
MKLLLIWLLLCISTLCTLVDSKPTIYKKNENDKLEPLLVPVSSTVIPLPVYKVGLGLGVHESWDKTGKPEEKLKLITVNKKKVTPKDRDELTVVKQITKEEYETQ